MKMSFSIHSLHNLLGARLVGINWLIPNTDSFVITEPSTGSLVHSSFSRSYSDDECLETYRFLNRHQQSCQTAITAWSISSKSRLLSGIISNAEDARAFIFNGSHYIYFQRPAVGPKGLPDCSIHVFDPILEKEWQVLVNRLKFNGKNWIPYEKDGTLFFIYSIHPLIVIECDWNESSEIRGRVIYSDDVEHSREIHWGDDLEYFGAARGGSQLLKLADDKYLGFTHITSPGLLKFSHQAGVLLFNPQTNQVSHKAISKLSPGLLVDPFGIALFENNVEMSYSYAVNNPSDEKVIVGCNSIVFSLVDLLKIFEIPAL